MKSNLQHSDSTDLLVTLLVRFPEVFSVRYEQKRDTLVFTFILKEIIDEPKCAFIKNQFKDYLETYRLIEPYENSLGDNISLENDISLGTDDSVGKFGFFIVDSVSFLTYEQSPHALHTSELKLLTGLLRERFQESMHAEELPLKSEELRRQEDSIQSFLGKPHFFHGEKNIEAFRDGQQVFIYNKP